MQNFYVTMFPSKRSSLVVLTPHIIHNYSTHSDEGLAFETSSFYSCYSGNKTRCSCSTPLPTQHHSLFRDWPPLFSEGKSAVQWIVQFYFVCAKWRCFLARTITRDSWKKRQKKNDKNNGYYQKQLSRFHGDGHLMTIIMVYWQLVQHKTMLPLSIPEPTIKRAMATILMWLISRRSPTQRVRYPCCVRLIGFNHVARFHFKGRVAVKTTI